MIATSQNDKLIKYLIGTKKTLQDGVDVVYGKGTQLAKMDMKSIEDKIIKCCSCNYWVKASKMAALAAIPICMDCFDEEQ